MSLFTQLFDQPFTPLLLQGPTPATRTAETYQAREDFMPHVKSVRGEFKRYRDRPFLLVHAGGNFGDHLIWWGCEQLADEVGLKWTAIDFDNFMTRETDPNQVIYLHGVGGFNRWCSGKAIAAFAKALATHKGVVVQGPQTCEDDEEYISKLYATLGSSAVSERIVMFCRERVTHQLMLDAAPHWIEVGLDKDTALQIDGDTFRKRSGIGKPTYDLLGIREDNEQPDVPVLFQGGVRLDPALFATSFEHWLRLHAAARTIITNRTHSAIAGAILGVPTVMMASRYHKNHSVWKFSLAERHVVWCNKSEALPFKQAKAPDVLAYLPGFLGRSWKIRMLSFRLLGVPIR